MKREKPGFWVTLTAAVFYPVAALLARQRYVGADRVPPRGGALLVMNHISHIDPVYDTVFVHKQGRNPHVFAKHTLWQYPLVKRVMTGSGQIPVHRGSVTAGHSLRAGTVALDEGKVVINYPEGTITRDPDGWPMVAYTGAARLALDLLDTDVPILPVARWGTRTILDGYRRRFRPFPRHQVTYLVGEPVDLSAYRHAQVTGAVLREVTDLLMKQVRELLAEIRQQPAPRRFFPRASPAKKAGA